MRDKINQWLRANYPNLIISVKTVTGISKPLDEIMGDCFNDLQGWVSVQNRLPDDGVCVDVYIRFIGGYGHGENERIENVFYSNDGDHWWTHGDNLAYVKLDFCCVTHWRPLPEPPK